MNNAIINRALNHIQPDNNSPILYWMTREHRFQNNWSLHYANELALNNNSTLVILFCLRKNLKPIGTRRMLDFMLKGLKEVERDSEENKVPFILKLGDPVEVIPQLVKQHNFSAVVTDLFPIRPYTDWTKKLRQELDIPLVVVDSHNIIPIHIASDKQEYAARTIRPKIHKHLDKFLIPFPRIRFSKATPISTNPIDWKMISQSISVREDVKPVETKKPGYDAAQKQLDEFISNKLNGYSENRNDPNKDSLSDLSPYLHFGHISAQEVALKIAESKSPLKDKDTFLEELIVRKELADNYCYYNQNYDSSLGFSDWAKITLSEHADDKREFLYSLEQLEQAQTHDEAWNAAQMEMVNTGKMHGYMRMYWAKKILEWSPNPQAAMDSAIILNDTYELDGRDPNGYTGIAWSMGGIHDRPWFERAVFGKIRYMNYNGLKRKFDIKKYIEQHA